jgi:hypothetical protein
VTIWYDTLVDKVIFQGNKAVGAQVSRYLSCGKLEKVNVTTRIEILVCVEVQGSAKLLLLSHVSIGPIFAYLLVIVTVALCHEVELLLFDSLVSCELVSRKPLYISTGRGLTGAGFSVTYWLFRRA